MNDDIRKVLTERVSVSVVLAGKAFGLGRNSAYQAIKEGQLPSVRIGNKIAVPTAPLRQMLGIEGGEAA
jgi:hypothetical protein